MNSTMLGSISLLVRITYPDVKLAIMDMPTTVIKKSDQLDMNDLVYVLNCQLGLLIAKRFG